MDTIYLNKNDERCGVFGTFEAMKRLCYLDNLKVFLTVMVILHHAGQAYGDGGAWGYAPSNSEEYVSWLWRFFSVNSAFLMGLYFMISAYFVPKSYDRQGFWPFLKKKLMRLGIPILFMGVIATPVSGFIDIGHTWFLEQLLFYAFIYAIFRVLSKNRGVAPIGEGNTESVSQDKCSTSKCGLSAIPIRFFPTMAVLLLLSAILSVARFYISGLYPQNTWIWLFGFLRTEPAHLAQYVLLFVMGLFASRMDFFKRMTHSVGAANLIIGLFISCLIWFDLKGSFLSKLVLDNWFVTDSVLAITLSVGLIWLFRELFNGTNRFMQWCADNAYGAYVFHIIQMLGLQYLTDGLWLGGGFQKFLFIGIVSIILSFTISWLVRMIPGVKKVL